jgi:hypothetical protein
LFSGRSNRQTIFILPMVAEARARDREARIALHLPLIDWEARR